MKRQLDSQDPSQAPFGTQPRRAWWPLVLSAVLYALCVVALMVLAILRSQAP